MIREAPEIRAPWTPLSPSGPQPTIATASGIDERRVTRCRPAEAGNGDATAHHPKVYGRGLCHKRHHPFLEGDHQLRQAADVRVRIHRCAVAHLCHGHQIIRALTAEELAHVSASAETLITGAALRRARYAHAIAHLYSSDFRANRRDDADAAVSLNQRHLVQPARPASGGAATGAFGRGVPAAGAGGGGRRSMFGRRPSTAPTFE